MSKAAKSVYVFGIYLAFTGGFLLLLPNTLIGMVGLAETNEVWIRVVGMLVLFLSFYYTQAARSEMTDFFRWTVYVRSLVIVFFSVFVFLGFAKLPLILFGVIDLLCAGWTGMALKAEEKQLA